MQAEFPGQAQFLYRTGMNADTDCGTKQLVY